MDKITEQKLYEAIGRSFVRDRVMISKYRKHQHQLLQAAWKIVRSVGPDKTENERLLVELERGHPDATEEQLLAAAIDYAARRHLHY